MSCWVGPGAVIGEPRSPRVEMNANDIERPSSPGSTDTRRGWRRPGRHRVRLVQRTGHHSTDGPPLSAPARPPTVIRVPVRQHQQGNHGSARYPRRHPCRPDPDQLSTTMACRSGSGSTEPVALSLRRRPPAPCRRPAIPTRRGAPGPGRARRGPLRPRTHGAPGATGTGPGHCRLAPTSSNAPANPDGQGTLAPSTVPKIPATPTNQRHGQPANWASAPPPSQNGAITAAPNPRIVVVRRLVRPGRFRRYRDRAHPAGQRGDDGSSDPDRGSRDHHRIGQQRGDPPVSQGIRRRGATRSSAPVASTDMQNNSASRPARIVDEQTAARTGIPDRGRPAILDAPPIRDPASAASRREPRRSRRPAHGSRRSGVASTATDGAIGSQETARS